MGETALQLTQVFPGPALPGTNFPAASTARLRHLETVTFPIGVESGFSSAGAGAARKERKLPIRPCVFSGAD
ncbi:MAG TPA: hypothetical protein VFW94_01820 [Candidatus Acidoferrales bacterium]|nr:hypothetical protein [Candidatus Acidoferrales bacterium]